MPRKGDERGEDVRGLRRKTSADQSKPNRYETEIRRYFEARRARLEIVKTTRTPKGQTIDWVPAASQVPAGEKLAVAPPSPSRRSPSAERKDQLIKFELEDRKVERGPKGTVPILRKNLEEISFDQPLRKLLGKYPYAGFHSNLGGTSKPQPSVDGPHWHASSLQNVTCFGGETVISAFDPYCENSDDFSLLQILLSNSDLPQLQTLEAGWQERKDSYGDWVPHLFTYYTTNGYTDDDDNKGGYNQDVDGWVQVDSSIHPGAIGSPTSIRGGAQYGLHLKYQLFEGNWWLMCNGRWLGYYPASLFMGRQSLFTTLGDHADAAYFFGEVYDSNKVKGKTSTDMGSGYWPDYGWQWAAYQHNLQVQTDRAGTMADFNGIGWTEAPDMYDIETHMLSGSPWGSYIWVGGPGAG